MQKLCFLIDQKTFFSPEQLQEIRYASLLHDFGKIGVREEVLLKAKKLYPGEAQAVMDRFQLIHSILCVQAYQTQLGYFKKYPKKKALEQIDLSE